MEKNLRKVKISNFALNVNLQPKIHKKWKKKSSKTQKKYDKYIFQN